jgi:putative transposase
MSNRGRGPSNSATPSQFLAAELGDGPKKWRSRKKWRRGRLDVAPAGDLLKRDLSASRPNERWVADITEFSTGEGKLFLTGVRDLCDRGLVGWSMGNRQTSELVIEAVTMAVARREPSTGLVHHSDKGSLGSTHRSTSPTVSVSSVWFRPMDRQATVTTTPPLRRFWGFLSLHG